MTPPATIRRAPFGETPGGSPVEALTLALPGGLTATVLTYGATLQALLVPLAGGRTADVALGHATLGEYRQHHHYLGATVGRVANRFAGGRFALDGVEHRVPPNDGANALHGGPCGFDAAVWTIAGTVSGDDFAEVVLRHVSPDGDQGFPGRLVATARYRLSRADELLVELSAETDRPTVVALTHHPYWNLAGEGSARGALEQLLRIPADSFLPVDDGLIPTGEVRTVEGTAFDFRQPRPIGAKVRTDEEQIRIGCGYDHCWVLARAPAPEPRLMAALADPASGRSLEVWSNQPGLQVYSGNSFDATSCGKSGRLYRQGDGVALEPQALPDTVNQPAFGSVRLEPGETYRNTILYRFGRG